MKKIFIPHISRFNLYLFLINFSLWGLVIRYLPQSNYSSFFTQYRVDVVYGTLYLIKNYHALNVSKVPVVSAYGNLLGYNTLDIGFQYINAFLLITMGIHSLSQDMFFFRFFPWQSILLVPLTAVLVYNQISRTLSKPIKYINICLVYLLSLFLSYNYLDFSNDSGTNPIYGVWIVLILFYLLLKISINNTPQNKVYIFLVVLFSGWIQTIYHTYALILLILLFSILVLQYASKAKFIDTNFFVLYTVIFLSYIVYIAKTYLYSYTSLISSCLHIFDTESIVMPSNGLVNVSSSLVSIFLQMVNYVLLIIPIIIFIYQSQIKHKYQDPAGKLLYYFILSMGSILLFHFIWKGFVGVERGFTYYGLIVCVITFSYLLANITSFKCIRKLFSFLALSVIFICVISTYSYISRDVSIQNSLTHPEEDSLLWGSSYIPNESVIFSDLRLSTPFLFFDHFKLLGINERSDPKFAKYSVESIFYSKDVESAISCLSNIKTWSGESSNYVLFSKEMTKPTPSFRGTELTYKPAPENFIEKYNHSPTFFKLYENGYTYIYYFQK